MEEIQRREERERERDSVKDESKSHLTYLNIARLRTAEAIRSVM